MGRLRKESIVDVHPAGSEVGSEVDAELLGEELHHVGRQHPCVGRQAHCLQLLRERFAPSVEGVDTHPGLVGQSLF